MELVAHINVDLKFRLQKACNLNNVYSKEYTLLIAGFFTYLDLNYNKKYAQISSLWELNLFY